MAYVLVNVLYPEMLLFSSVKASHDPKVLHAQFEHPLKLLQYMC